MPSLTLLGTKYSFSKPQMPLLYVGLIDTIDKLKTATKPFPWYIVALTNKRVLVKVPLDATPVLKKAAAVVMKYLVKNRMRADALELLLKHRLEEKKPAVKPKPVTPKPETVPAAKDSKYNGWLPNPGKSSSKPSFGFWPSSKDKKDLTKMIALHTDKSKSAAWRASVAKVLKKGHKVTQYRGYASCRICKKLLGTADLELFGFVYPEGFEHYVLEHNIVPPKSFLAKLKLRTANIPDNIPDAYQSPTNLEFGFWPPHDDRNGIAAMADRYSDQVGHSDAWRNRLAKVLESGNVVSTCRGWAQCRLCHAKLGNSTLELHGYTYPQKFEHYVLEHRLVPPAGFLAKAGLIKS